MAPSESRPTFGPGTGLVLSLNGAYCETVGQACRESCITVGRVSQAVPAGLLPAVAGPGGQRWYREGGFRRSLLRRSQVRERQESGDSQGSNRQSAVGDARDFRNVSL